MQLALSLPQLRQMRLRNQLLAEGTCLSSSADVARQLCALQSQEWPAAQLAIHARSHGITKADVIHAREVERSFLLTWSLRGTLHLVAAEDLDWQLELCAPPAIRGTNSRYKQLGLTEDLRRQALEAIGEILSRDGALNRARLAEALHARGIPVAGQAIHHLARFAALSGLICLGPELDGELTYALLDSWLPAGSTKQSVADPLREFALRYLSACGPATLADFTRWSGLSLRQAKAAWAAASAECLKVSIPAGEALMLKQDFDQLESASDTRMVRLLPRYDNYLLGYESRQFMVEGAHAKRVHPGGGLIRACVLVDGEAKANWKLVKRRAGITVVVSPFEPLHPSVPPFLNQEVQSLSRFLDTNADLRVEGG